MTEIRGRVFPLITPVGRVFPSVLPSLTYSRPVLSETSDCVNFSFGQSSSLMVSGVKFWVT